MGMSQYSEQLKELTHIRSMMEKSTRFVSLSGITGIAIGLIALVAAAIVFIIAKTAPFQAPDIFWDFVKGFGEEESNASNARITLYAIAIITLISSVITGLLFTIKKTKKNNIKLWTKSFRLMLLNIAIPLAAGGIFCLILINLGFAQMVAGSMLVFYGLALINGAKYTLQDVNSLGLIEIILGLFTLWINKYGIEMWAIGFGVLHIIYGAKIYFTQQDNG
jgi:hypothetical protein